jgi:hypothetical protein
MTIPATDSLPVPSVNLAAATEEERLAWVKARAAAQPWHLALNSVIIDMQLAGIPLRPDLIDLAAETARTGGERAARHFIGSLTLGSVYARASETPGS